ncbi:MAG TPA: putative Ig domain-containing protein [Candidatus Sulfotelmatobacter sp.]|nr:putative Ig domain-containing protein [Candidatus Sulfotelmatobacter sp.]
MVLLGTLVVAGCSNLQNLSQSSTSHTLAVSSTLPPASVGTTYKAVLSVNGGRAPYHFLVVAGTLPPGLTIDSQAGIISGVPTVTGTFNFNVSVEDTSSATVRMSGTHSYSLIVGSCESCIRITITPPTPSVSSGGKLQLSALVSNVSNPAVTWTASSGTISSNGLFTAPVVNAPLTVTVTAKSLAQPSSEASTTVSVGSSNVSISTSSIPSATMGVPYNTSLIATGGQPPYQWSISSGSLPLGLELTASSGGLSGAITKSGTFAFSVRVTDAAAQSAQQNLTLVVSNTNASCGPPKYGCSRTDLLTANILGPVPNVGNLNGAGTIVTDPSFVNRIARITDARTNPGMLDRTYMAGQGGSADVNIWNSDSTLLFVQDDGSWMVPMTFDPVSLKAGRLYTARFPNDGGLKLLATGAWSYNDPNVLYTIETSTTTLNKYDFTDRVNPPTPTQIFDFRTGSHCLPNGFTVTWSNVGGGNSDDTVFALAYSNQGDQGTGVYAVAYKAGKGCTLYNTQTGQVTGDWGTQGTVTVPDRFTIHNVKLSKDGNWLVIVNTTCFAGTCEGPFFWQVGTTTVNACAKNGCSGHWTEGQSTWINGDGTPLDTGSYENGQYKARPFSTPALPRNLVSQFPLGMENPYDMHASWNNADPADTYPFFSSTWTSITSPWVTWYNEIIGISPVNGTVWRFAHTYVTAASQRFSTKYAIGSISQDGRFFAFSSDWMGTLGSESGSSSCTVGTDCRGDVFVVALQ